MEPFLKTKALLQQKQPRQWNIRINLNKAFANRSKEEEIFPLTTPEIAEAQKADIKLKHCLRRNAVLDKGLEVRLVDNTYVVCKDAKW